MLERIVKIVQQINENPTPQAESQISPGLSADLRRMVVSALRTDSYYNVETGELITGMPGSQVEAVDKFLCDNDTMCRISRTVGKFGLINSDWGNHSIMIEFFKKSDDPMTEIKRKFGSPVCNEKTLEPQNGERYFSIELLQVSDQHIAIFEIRSGENGTQPTVINPPSNPTHAETMSVSQFARWEARQAVRAYFPANQLMMGTMTDEEIARLFDQ